MLYAHSRCSFMSILCFFRMRFLGITIGVGFGIVQSAGDSSPECDTVDDSWYSNLIYCGVTGSGVATVADLNTCIDALTASATQPAKSTSLYLIVDGGSSTCLDTCIAEFAVGMTAKKSHFVTECGYDADKWDTPEDLNIGNSACLVYLYEEINAFNTCANAGSVTTVDVVTGTTSVRCTTADFVEFEKTYRAWGPMVLSALADRANDSGYTGPSGWNNALGDLTCGSCFTELYETINAAELSGCTGETERFSRACRANEAVAAALETFAVCTGGHYINTYGCTAENENLFDTVLRPYNAYSRCYELWDPDDPDAHDACLGTKTGVHQPTVQRNCDPCYEKLSQSLLDNAANECATDAFDAECVASFTTAPAAGTLGSSSDEFEICSGFAMDITPTVCDASEWSELSDRYKSLVPMYLAAKYASDEYEAGNMISNNDDLYTLLVATNELTCFSCFNAFVVDAYIASTNYGVATDCLNPYTTACADALPDILTRFKFCSGHWLTYPAVSTVCSESEFDVMLAVGATDDALAAGLDSITEVHLEAVLARIADTLAEVSLDIPCWPCVVDLARTLYALSSTNQAKCEDISSTNCYAVIGDEIDAFETCSGFEFALAPTTTTTTTTTTITTGTTAATTVTTTTTTTAATTTAKSSGLFPAGFVIMGIAISLLGYGYF